MSKYLYELLPPQMAAAMIRAIGSAFLVGVSTTLSTYTYMAMQSTVNWTLAIVGGVSTAIGILVTRWGFEGAYDSHRNAVGDVQRGDVGAELPPRRF